MEVDGIIRTEVVSGNRIDSADIDLHVWANGLTKPFKKMI